MKNTLFAFFIALIMVGCGEEPAQNSPESNQTSAEPLDAKTAELTKVDLDDPETRDKIISEAIDFYNLKYRGKEGEGLVYASNQQTPYTGWGKGGIYRNGQIGSLTLWKSGKKDGVSIGWDENGQKKSEVTYKEGKADGLGTLWYENGHKKGEGNFKDGKQDGPWVTWYENGQKQAEGSYKDGNKDGLWTYWYKNGLKKLEEHWKDGKVNGARGTFWYENGQKEQEFSYKDGKVVSAVVWKPNGEKCPVTNVKDGNGVVVTYYEDGTEVIRVTYKDGEPVD